MATKSSIMDTNSYSDDYSSLLSNTTRDMINRREKWMGGAYRLFYRKPVNLVRGQGQYLWDAEGNKYLDMYNSGRNRSLPSCCGQGSYRADEAFKYPHTLSA